MKKEFRLIDKCGELFFITITLEKNKKDLPVLSISGRSKDCSGQLYDVISPANNIQKAFISFWRRWHLNDLNAGCVHQMKSWNTKKRIETHEYTASLHFYKRVDKIIELVLKKISETGSCKIGELAQKLLSLPRYKTYNDMSILTVPEYFRKQFKVSKTIIKDADFVNAKEHEEGLLEEPCPVCGYKYGSAWVYEELPSQIEKAIDYFSKNINKGEQNEKL